VMGALMPSGAHSADASAPVARTTVGGHHACMNIRSAREPRQVATEAERRVNLNGPAAGRIGIVGVLAFLLELAVFALLAATGWNLADALGLRLALAFLLPVAAIAIWGRWFAPRSRLRVPQPRRVIAQLGVFAASGLLAVAADLGPFGWILPSAAGLVFGVGFLSERQSGSPAADRT